MKRNILITLIVVVLVGACTATLFYNKKTIDEKARLDGNLKTIPVFVEELRKSSLSGTFESNGTFSAIHELTLMAEGQGRVTQLLFNTGDVVAAGKVLATLDDELVRSQLSLAEAALLKSKNDLKKYEDLLADDAISSQQVEDARLGLKKAETDLTALRKQLENASVKAPISGTITLRFIEKGSLVMPGTPVAEIVDVSRLKFIAKVAESEAVQIAERQRVTLTSSLFPGVIFDGTVRAIGVKADDSKRFPVEIEVVNNPKHPLRAGMFGTAIFSTGTGRESLMIARQAIVGSIKDPRVYVVEGDMAVLRDIRIGTATDRQVEVLDGLREGEKVVISGQINLADRSKINIVSNK
jgi:RND family efflux transporter MFP subunit